MSTKTISESTEIIQNNLDYTLFSWSKQKGIDPIAVLDIQKIIKFLTTRNIGVLITDHNVRETLGICDRAYIVNQGTVFASGEPSEIVYNEAVREVYLGKDFRL